MSDLARPGVFRLDISLNPSTDTFDRVIEPLLDEAHERVARAANAMKRKSD